MALGGCLTCIKYLLFIFNFLFWLAGCVLLGFGIWLVVDPKSFGDTGLTSISIGGIGLIVIGSIVTIVGFFGCCGAIRESQCLLITFFICLFIIFGVLLGIGIYFAVAYGKTEDAFKDAYEKVAKEYNADPGNSAKKEAVENFNKPFKCCGYKLGALDFPGPKPAGCGLTDQLPLCPKALKDATSSFGLIMAGIALGIGVVLLLGMIFSLMLCCAIRDSV